MELAKEAGLPNSAQISSHSVRRGFATEGARLGASMPAINISEAEFTKLRDEIKKYRDQFVAHLDSAEKFFIPFLGKAFLLAKFYYNQIMDELEQKDFLPVDLQDYYDLCLKNGNELFAK